MTVPPFSAAARFRRILLPVLVLLAGCRRQANAPPAAPSHPLRVTQRPLRLALPEADRERIIVAYYRKPVMGRRTSMRDVERIITTVTPILERAAKQDAVAGSLDQIASDYGISADEARERWVRLQEADILLESGGDPEDVSSANAVGVAQWIYETGRRAGLKVDLPKSRALTAQIDPLKRDVAWLEYLAAPGAKPGLPGSPALIPEQAAEQLPGARARLEQLRAQRRGVDERYDPEKALFAHTRYLLGLTPRFPDLQWVFQAFHGGEAGVARLLAKYIGPKWKGTAAQAIRTGSDGKRLTYERVYATASPTSHAAAFSYLYGRGDDHRHYWWKIRAAEEAFALYRKDRAEFQRTWESLLPGRAKEAMWYPNGPAEALSTPADITAAIQSKFLVPISFSGIAPKPGGPEPPALRPESAGLLRLLSAAFRRAGGKHPLAVGDLTIAQDRLAKPPPRYTPGPADPLLASLPGGGPPADFNFHATGLAFDLIRPADDNRRKTLEYALGWLRDRDALWFMEEADRGQRRFHVVPNPAFRDALVSISRTGALPAPLGAATPPRPPASLGGGRIRRPAR